MTFGQVDTWSKIIAKSTGATSSRMTVKKFAGVAMADGPYVESGSIRRSCSGTLTSVPR